MSGFRYQQSIFDKSAEIGVKNIDDPVETRVRAPAWRQVRRYRLRFRFAVALTPR